MDAEKLRSVQAPLKAQYRDQPESAKLTLRAQGRLGEGVTCRVDTAGGRAIAGLHPATGGSGQQLCSGNLLLEALVACAGVTLGAVATALNLEIRDAAIEAEGDLDFRGTLAVSKEVPVGFQAIRLRFKIDSPATDEQRASLIKLTERYCVVLQTLMRRPEITVQDMRVG